MWKPCPVVFDVPLTLIGFEYPDDFFVILGFLITGGIVFDSPLYGIGLTALGAATLYLVKRGKAPGQVFHTLHRFECWRLSGVLSPRSYRYDPW